MAYFAEMANNIVVTVLAVNNNDINDLPFPESEPVGQAYLAACGFQGTYLQTSFNSNFRKCLAEPGATYDVALDAFIPPEPVSSSETFVFDYELWRWVPAPIEE